MHQFAPWLQAILANPITKEPAAPDAFPIKYGVLDARVFLKHTYGYSTWAEGQDEYESLAGNDASTLANYRAEIDYDRPIYTHFPMSGRILDVGGGGRGPYANSCQRMLNSYQSILGYTRPPQLARSARQPIHA